MTFRARALVRELAGSWLGERAVPVGDVAANRRLLRRALSTLDLGSVLVVGAGLAARQALPSVEVDVAGTSPHMHEVTVCSRVDGSASLPAARWDTVVVLDPGADLRGRLRAVLPASRAAGLLVLLDRAAWSEDGPELRALREQTRVVAVHGGGRRRLWIAEVPG